jgi:hypothetical protein
MPYAEFHEANGAADRAMSGSLTASFLQCLEHVPASH